MIEATKQLQRDGLPPPVCIAVHGLFVGNAYADLRATGVAEIVSCDSVAHESNRIALSGALAGAPSGHAS